MTETIYIAPNIRTQKIEDVEAFLEAKRARRLITANRYQETLKQKAEQLHGKGLIQFEKQVEIIDRAMNKIAEDFVKLDNRLEKLNALHTDLVNLEGTINEEN